MKKLLIVVVGVAALETLAAPPSGNNFMQSQAMAEVNRVAGQLDVVNSNLDDLSQRVHRLEAKGNDNSVRHEIDALKASIQELRREMQNQRAEIVKDLMGRISSAQTAQAKEEKKARAAAQAASSKPSYDGPVMEYEVVSGDNLFFIAKAFNTSVNKLKEMNNLKNNNLRVGQKLLVPKQ